jgi:hypothetical protein
MKKLNFNLKKSSCGFSEKRSGRMPLLLPVQSLIIKSLDCRGITLSWKAPIPLCNVTRYLLSYSSTFLAQGGGSPLEDVQRNITIDPSIHSYTISDPHSLSVYNVCVVAEYTSGLSTLTCVQNTTGDLGEKNQLKLFLGKTKTY